jgi:hypothetical protein
MNKLGTLTDEACSNDSTIDDAAQQHDQGMENQPCPPESLDAAMTWHARLMNE